MITKDKDIIRILKSLWFKRFTLWTIGFFVFVILLIFGTLKFLIYQVENETYGTFTNLEELTDESPFAPTIVYTSDSIELTRFYIEDRKNVDFEDLSDELVTTLITFEDPRYNQYNVVDFKGASKVFFKAFIGGNGSFHLGLAWQLTHHPFLYYKPKRRRVIFFFDQIIDQVEHYVKAKRLTDFLGKKELLAFYLNQQEFLFNCRGISAATNYYFGKNPIDLGWNESAVLVGMLGAPSFYNPKTNPANSVARRNAVLSVLKSNSHISATEYDSLKALPIELFNKSSLNINENNFLKDRIREELRSWCGKNKRNLYQDGLEVYTTVDSRIQKYVIEAGKRHMAYIQKRFNQHWEKRKKPWHENEIIDFEIKHTSRYNWLLKRRKKRSLDKPTLKDILLDFEGERKMNLATPLGIIDTFLSPLDSLKFCMGQVNCGVLVLKPNTGEVLAWLGGKDYEFSKYDQVKAPGKQIGSLIKALNYLSAIEKGANPCAAIEGGPNMPFINFMCYSPSSTYTPARVYADSSVVDNYLLALNLKDSTQIMHRAFEILYGKTTSSLLQTTLAFNTFNNGGKLVEPSLISTITRCDTLLFKSNASKKAVFTETEANSVHGYLKNVVNHGSGMRLRSNNYYGIKSPIAGTQGSTVESKDNWYMGFTPDFTIGVWAGSAIDKVAFRDFAAGSGTRQAMPIFGEIVNSINKDATIAKTNDWFEHNNEKIDCE